MLSLDSVFVGYISDAEAWTLALRRGKHDDVHLMVPVDGKIFAVILEGSHRFHTFDVEQNNARTGLLVPGIRLEVDPSAVLDPNENDVPLGALLRDGPHLKISTVAGAHYSQRRQIIIASDLPTGKEAQAAAFYRWFVTIGAGTEKQTLHKVDVTPKQTAQ